MKIVFVCRDKLRAYALKEEKEQELNRILRKDRKSAIYLGSPYELMGDVMHYERRAGAGRALGHDLEYLILHDNVSVRPNNEPEDESDSADYKLVMIPSRNPGFTQLQLSGESLPDVPCRPRLSVAGGGDGSRSGRSASVSSRDRPTAASSASRRASLRRTRSESVLSDSGSDRQRGTARGRRSSTVPEEASEETGEPAPRAEVGVSAELALPPADLAGDREATPNDDPAKASQTRGDDSAQTSLSDRGAADGMSSSAEEERSQERGETPSSTQDTGDLRVKDDDHASDQRVPPSSKPSSNRQRKRGVIVNSEEADNTGPNPSPEASLSKNPGTGHSTATEPDRKAAETVPSQSGQGGGNHPAVPTLGGWMPGFPPMMTYPQYPTPQLPPGSLHSSQYPVNAYPYPGQFPQYAPAADGAQPQYPGIIPGYPYALYPAFPPHLGVYPYAGAPVTEASAGHQMPGVPTGMVPGHFGYYPHTGVQSPANASDRASEDEKTNIGASSEDDRATVGVFKKAPQSAATQAATRQRKTSKVQQSEAGLIRRKSGTQDPEPDPHRKRSLSELIRSSDQASSVCSEDSHGSFVMLPDSTTDEESEAPGHLPKYCFRKFEIIIKNDDDDDEDHWTPSRKEIHRYLSSELFVNHFTDHFGELAKLMARDVWLKQADTNFLRGPTVFCREQLADGLRTTALITPTLVSSSWPRAALEWGFRDRPRLVDMERRMQYQWPPERVVRELCQEGVCNLVPQGCYVREGLRAARHFSPRRMAVEWEVCFQQADMRLISSLEAVHVHFWAVAKLMFTHFLSEFRCLHERHIRHLIFWQFERNIRDWWPQALGGSLVELLRSLEKSVRERELKHYFVPRRNMLESETSEGLLLAQERLRRILENPVPNLLIALSRLRVRGDAFPEFDWQQLFHYLTVSGTDLLKEASPALREVPGEEPSSDAEDKDKDDDPMFVPTKEELREQDRQRQLRRRQAAEAAAAERRRQQRRRRRPLPDFADPHVKMQWLNGPDSRLRALRVLNMFVRHFSAMAERLLEHEALEPALSYADHTLNLCQLLEDQAGSEEADQARQRLWELRARAAALVPATEDDLPEQPDTDLLEVGAGGSSARGDNWTLGPAAGRGVRRDYNLEEAVAGGEQSAASRPARQAAEVATSA
ncbi:uncharacterized protein LOC122368186 [Amphibalanus amphitrite]|uniref:uncharacterized protein LOC122368186 n=1 Tax=Amphibalanus amphitrite TaxID=1232801 RepID=UPI001C9081B1|nr:uncharacterized protein LOC122368186 [Amphibalanus amphitrite]